MGILDYKEVSRFFKLLSHPIRLMIVEELLKGRKCVRDMTKLVSVRQPTISQHVSLLRLCGIIDWEQKGKTKCYFLKDPKLIKNLLKIMR